MYGLVLEELGDQATADGELARAKIELRTRTSFIDRR